MRKRLQIAAAVAVAALTFGVSTANATPGKNGTSCSNATRATSIATMASLVGTALSDYDTLTEAGSLERFIVGNLIDTTGFIEAMSSVVDLNGDDTICVKWVKAGPGDLKHHGLDNSGFTNVFKFGFTDNATNAS